MGATPQTLLMSIELGYIQNGDGTHDQWAKIVKGVESIVAQCPSPRPEVRSKGNLFVIHPRDCTGCEPLMLGTRAAVNQQLLGDPEGVSFEDGDTGEFTEADGNVRYKCKVGRGGDPYEKVVEDCLRLLKQVLGPAVELSSEDERFHEKVDEEEQKAPAAKKFKCCHEETMKGWRCVNGEWMVPV